MAWVPDSQSQQQYSQDYEATQVDPPLQSQASQAANSQVEPRRKYWAVLIPINPAHSILKIPWSRTRLQIGRGTSRVGNEVILHEKRVSNRHCRIMLGLHGKMIGTEDEQARLVQQLKDGEAEPEVWIEDLKSSNGTFVNGIRIEPRRILVHGDEVSLGLQGTADNHDVRYIFRSVGPKGTRMGSSQHAPGEVYQKYQMLSVLGKGTFAEVRKAVDIDTGDLRAIKQIVKHRFDHNPKTLALFQREIDICTQLHHENICRLIDWYTDPQHICLVLEYIDGGDLLEYIMKCEGTGLSENEAADLTFQICRAMAYCHENGVTHRDLKPENILLTKETEAFPRIIKIADFGLAKMVKSQTMLVSMVGTPQYLAPEVVMQTKQRPGYENVVDSWSVGIIVYSMLTKSLPFDDSPDLTVEQRIRQRYHMDYDREPLHTNNVSDEAIDFISRLLERDPAKRMTMADALEHEWLAGPTSSLPNESPSQVLGGDSMWNIQSFDSVNDIEDEDANSDRWSRPMTTSTNFDASATGESFSQPMQALQIQSEANFALSPTREEDEGDIDWDNTRRRVSGTAGLTPSPDVSMEQAADLTPKKKTANGMEVDAPPAPSMDLDEKATSGATALSTATANGHKRKQESMFSSGSLSPPPDERETTPQPPKPVGRLTRAATARTAASPAKPESGRRKKSQRLL